MSEHLCAIVGCVDFGQHQDGCADQRCRGCRPRHTERGLVCEPHRIQLPTDLDQLEELWSQLGARDNPTDLTPWTARIHRQLPVPTTNPARLAAWLEGPWIDTAGHDPVLTATPAGLIGRSHRRRVSGSRHAPVPANLTRLDLAADAREGSRAAHARGVLGLDLDQIGDLSVATELDTWARDWRDTLFPSHQLPTPTVPSLVDWLKNRLTEACNTHEGIDEFATDITAMRGTLTAALGLNPARKELCKGVACRSCDRKTLYRDGSDIQCGWCHQYYSEREYQDWTALLNGDAKQRIQAGELQMPKHADDRPERTENHARVAFPEWVR